MNLMVRGNLLFRLVPEPDRNLMLNVRLGSKDYPAESPNLLARRIRTNLTDNRRSMRIYGSSVVIGRLTGSGARLRLQLLNYAAASRPVSGIRVRVLDRYAYHASVTELLDYSVESDATEFT